MPRKIINYVHTRVRLRSEFKDFGLAYVLTLICNKAIKISPTYLKICINCDENMHKL